MVPKTGIETVKQYDIYSLMFNLAAPLVNIKFLIANDNFNEECNIFRFNYSDKIIYCQPEH